jgi:hypothetical protein
MDFVNERLDGIEEARQALDFVYEHRRGMGARQKVL